MGFSPAKLKGVAQVVGQMTDAQLRSLEAALIGAAQAGDTEMLDVLDAVGAEATDRAAAALALSPVAPLLGHPEGFPARTARAFWADVRALDADARREAVAAVLRLRGDDPIPAVFDEVCLRAAARVERGEGELGALLQADPGGYALALRLVPIVRRALAHLGRWSERLDAESAAGVRLAFKDAAILDSDSAPMLLRIMAAHLPDKTRVLRLIGSVADNVSDRFLAGSELAAFGEEMLDEMERRIAAARVVDFASGVDAGRRAAEELAAAMHVAGEFEIYVDLSKDGPWGPRIAAAKRAAASISEARLRELDGALNAALPLQAARFASRFVKGVPRLTRDPEPRALAKAAALAAFLTECRVTANAAGFSSLRSKVAEAVQERLSHYVEDLLDALHEDSQTPRAAEFLAHAADMVALIDGAPAGDIVRRRLSAAVSGEAHAA